MYTKGSLQQIFEIPNNNLDVEFETAPQNHNNETHEYYGPESRTSWDTIYDGEVSKRNNSDAQDVFHFENIVWCRL